MPCNTCVDPARCEQVCQNLLFTLSRTDHVTSNAFIASACQRDVMQQARDALVQITTKETFYRDPRGDNAGPAIDALGEALERVDANWCASACDQSGEVVAMVVPRSASCGVHGLIPCEGARCICADVDSADRIRTLARENDALRDGLRQRGDLPTLSGSAPQFTPIGRFFLRDGQWVRAAPGSPVGETLYRRTDGVALPDAAPDLTDEQIMEIAAAATRARAYKVGAAPDSPIPARKAWVLEFARRVRAHGVTGMDGQSNSRESPMPTPDEQ